MIWRPRLALAVRWPLVPALVSLVLVGCVAAARADWSAPTTLTLSQPYSFVAGLVVASGPAGDLVAWSTQADSHQPWLGHGAVAAPGGGFGSERGLPASGSWHAPTIVDLGGGRVAQMLLASDEATPKSVIVGSTAGVFGPPLRVPSAQTCLSSCGWATVTGNAKGDLLVTWVATGADGRQAVWASVRLGSGEFGAPQRLSGDLPQFSGGGAIDHPVVSGAVGADGVMVVAFDNERGRLLARVRRGRGAWGSTAVVGPSAPYGENDLSVFVGSQGEIVIAWYHASGTGAGANGPGDVDVAVRPIGAQRFLVPQLLHSDAMALDYAASGLSLAPAIAATPDRGPIIGFIARAAKSSANTVVMVAYPRGSGRTIAGSRYSAPARLSPIQATVTELQAAAGSAGEILAWTQSAGSSGPTAIMAATSAPGDAGGGFRAPEQVSPAGSEADHPAVAFNVASHWPGGTAPWIVAWLASTNAADGAAPGVAVQVAAGVSSVHGGIAPDS
jgi:hypothetical protein